MNVKVTDAGPCRKVLEVQAPPEAVAGEYDQTVRAFATMAKLPGFRPGKAPLTIVEKHYAKQIADEARDRLVPQFYHQALKEKGLKPVSIVDVKDVVFAKASGLAFHVTVDVAPEIKLPKYKGIPLKPEPVVVADEQVDGTVLRMRERLARFEPAAGRPAQASDLLRVDFDATVDGRPFAEVAPLEKALGEARDFLIYLGEPEFLPGFAKGLTGASAGDTRDLAVMFPADYQVKTLAGRQAQYRVTVKDLQQRVLPELTAEFLKHFEVETEQGLRERIRTQLLEHAQQNEDARQKDEVAKFLLEKTEFELPQSIVDRETQHTVRNMLQDISRRGASREQIVAQQEGIVNEATRNSTERVKLTYILERIADDETITASDEEVEERLKQMAAQYQIPVARLREDIEKRGSLENLRSEVQAQKTLTFLQKEAKVK